MRDPFPAEQFNAIHLPVKALKIRAPWFNLRWAANALPGQTYFASHSGRLTPSSGKVRCLYLARDCETAFEEVYGDAYDAAEKRSMVFAMPLEDTAQRVFLRTGEPFELRVYDLTQRGAGKRIGLDLGTLYAPHVRHTREFAQRLHDHPAKIDGILYRSRLMNTRCLVIWATSRSAVPALLHHSWLKQHLRSDPAIDPDCYLFKRRTALASVPTTG